MYFSSLKCWRLPVACLLLISPIFSYGSEFFIPDAKPNLGLLSGFKGSELCSVAENTHAYLEQHADDKLAVHAGKVFGNSVSLARVKRTLAFICQTYREDVRQQRNSRLHDPEFLKQHFDFLRWQPDKASADKIASASTNATKSRMLTSIPQDKLFWTKYYTKLLDASPVQTSTYDQALYALPFDEAGKTLEQAEREKEQLTRFRYTRQQVISGVLLEKKLANPLVWLTEEALHDVLLQGTGVMQVDGKTRYFNVHRNNGIGYDYGIGKREQPRYWYFAEVPSIMGYGKKLADKIAIKPQVSFAGNVADLGLGKLILMSYSGEDGLLSRMGVLADQGGAFDNNLFQLDMLVDSYYGWDDFHQANKQLPDYAQTWIMLLKDGVH